MSGLSKRSDQICLFLGNVKNEAKVQGSTASDNEPLCCRNDMDKLALSSAFCHHSYRRTCNNIRR